jgi:hypothetical protein
VHSRGGQAVATADNEQQKVIHRSCSSAMTATNPLVVERRVVQHLGADTPLAELTWMAADVHPDLVVLTAATPERLDGLTEHLSRLARLVPLALAGAGVTQTTADAVGARLLTDDPVTAAERMPPPSGPGHSSRPRPEGDPTGQAPDKDPTS